MKNLTEEERKAAMAICKELNDSKQGLRECDWPRFKHKKTGKIVKLQGVNTSWYAPSIVVIAVAKDPDKRHVRATPVGALNFRRDYEPTTLDDAAALAAPAAPLAAGAAAGAGETDLVIAVKRGLNALTFQQRVELCDSVGVHFAYLEAVLKQPGAQQSSLTAATFNRLVEVAIMHAALTPARPAPAATDAPVAGEDGPVIFNRDEVTAAHSNARWIQWPVCVISGFNTRAALTPATAAAAGTGEATAQPDMPWERWFPAANSHPSGDMTVMVRRVAGGPKEPARYHEDESQWRIDNQPITQPLEWRYQASK